MNNTKYFVSLSLQLFDNQMKKKKKKSNVIMKYKPKYIEQKQKKMLYHTNLITDRYIVLLLYALDLDKANEEG